MSHLNMEPETHQQSATHNPSPPPTLRQRSSSGEPCEREIAEASVRKVKSASWIRKVLLYIPVPWGAEEPQECPYVQQVQELDIELRRARDHISELKKEARHQISISENRAQQAQGRVLDERSKNRQLREQVEALQSEMARLESRIRKQEDQIRQAQAAAFTKMDSDSWVSGDDNTIRADLEMLHDRIKIWAKKYAAGDMAGALQVLQPQERESLVHALAEVMQPQALIHFQTDSMKKKSPALCLQALLSHHIFTNVIGSPFFVLNGHRSELLHLYNFLQQVNEQEAHRWRCKTLRLLSTAPLQQPTHAGALNDRYSTALETICTSLATTLLESPAKYLIKPSGCTSTSTSSSSPTPTSSPHNSPQTPPEGTTATPGTNPLLPELHSLYGQSALFSTKLWSRSPPVTLQMLSLPELGNKRFRSGSQTLQAHPLHRLYRDDDRCDGWGVGLVVQPGIVGFENGSREGHGRVWMKAEVWLWKGEEMQG